MMAGYNGGIVGGTVADLEAAACECACNGLNVEAAMALYGVTPTTHNYLEVFKRADIVLSARAVLDYGGAGDTF